MRSIYSPARLVWPLNKIIRILLLSQALILFSAFAISKTAVAQVIDNNTQESTSVIIEEEPLDEPTLDSQLEPPAPAYIPDMQNPQSALGVSPAIIEIILDPGQSTTEIVTVFNITNFPIPVKGLAHNFTVNEKLSLTEDQANIFNASQWIGLEPADFILQPNQEQEIIVTINTPENAEPGGHYATVYFQPLIPAEFISQQNTFLTARVGILTFFIVKGDIREEVNIKNLLTKNLHQSGPIIFDVPIINTGNVHIIPTGFVTIKNMAGKETAKLEISKGAVLPGTERILTAQWPKKLLFGKYSAQVAITYSADNRISQSPEITFWVVPWVMIIIIILSLTVVYLLLTIMRTRIVLALKILLGKADPKDVRITRSSRSSKN